MDLDGNGEVSRKEFRMAFEKRKADQSSKDYQPFFSESFFDMIDRNGNETITFKQLLRAMFPLANAQEMKAMMELVSELFAFLQETTGLIILYLGFSQRTPAKKEDDSTSRTHKGTSR